MNKIFLVVLGLSGGITVGAGVFAFFTVLGVLVRVIDISETEVYGSTYKIAIILGSLISTYIYIFRIGMNIGKGWLIVIGLYMGIFVGMVSSALAEVLNVIPSLSINMGITRWILLLIISIILGKTIGSIIYWVLPGFY